MLRDDLLDVLEKIPAEDMTKTVLSLRGIAAITIDTILRKEDDYLVLRGREAGTNDDGRVFFIPYEDILFIKIDRIMKIEEVKRMYGEKVTIPAELGDEKPAETKEETKAKEEAKAVQSAAMDPAAIAKQNLLARIRAAKSIASSGS
jgi:hypothetical protein